MRHIRNLSSSSFEGRLAGTQGYMQAAEYVAGELAKFGVKPYDGRWGQMFEIECNEIENCMFNSYLNDRDSRTPYVLGNDFICVSMTGRGYADAQVAFCGYGIDDPTFNEYDSVDARGKIVMVLSGVPTFLPSSLTDAYASVRDKARVAKKHGAVALVVVNMSQSCQANEVQGDVFCGPGPHLATFPLIQPTRACADRILASEKYTIDSVLTLMTQHQSPQSFTLLQKFEINVNAKYDPTALTTNVLGFIEGHDKRYRKEFIVVGANLDHLGMQGNTCLFPGASDNASGVAAMLETARLLALDDTMPARSVLFVCFSGKESQNMGSLYFVSHFNKFNKIDAFVNVDCVGNGDSLAVLGNKQFPALADIAYKKDSSFTNVLVHGFNTLPKGDAVAFSRHGVPSIVFTTYGGNRYNHVPSDISENVDRAFVTKAATLLYATVYELSCGDYQGRSRYSRHTKF